jgi:hypothetical protein
MKSLRDCRLFPIEGIILEEAGKQTTPFGRQPGNRREATTAEFTNQSGSEAS